ncbi:hypothetical protein FIM25_05650 [Desulfobotulus mexicanus]|uniref:Uncharacterized protein n=1 Tax=Desulfobotulus mexicanus TaxID=2586642 RepID=A0A5Q4VCC4_9BACT|nr:hypothetical protein FIM25_05650 [Desulfobotulus mexicanus]
MCSGALHDFSIGPAREELTEYFHGDDTLDLSAIFFYRGKGCTEYKYKDYDGRLIIHEVFVMTEAVRTFFSLLVRKRDTWWCQRIAAALYGLKFMAYPDCTVENTLDLNILPGFSMPELLCCYLEKNH